MDELQRIHKVVRQRGGKLIVDEIYHGLTYGTQVRSALELADDIFVINSFSKTYNMTGWRLGWAQSSEAVIRTLYKAAEFITSNPTAIVQQAGIVALRDGEDYVAELRSHYTRRRAQVTDAFKNLEGVTLAEPQGAFYAFPRIEGLTDSTALTAELLRETGVALAPGVAFGESGEGFVRLCFAASEATVTDALARIRSFFDRR